MDETKRVVIRHMRKGEDGFRSYLVGAIYRALALGQIKPYKQYGPALSPLDRVETVWNAVGVTYVLLGEGDGTGYAFCGPLDEFDESRGTEIALGRARKDAK